MGDDLEGGGRRGLRGRLPSVGLLYGALWGILGGALTVLWTTPPDAEAGFFAFMGSSSELLSFAIYFGLAFGVFGYLIRSLSLSRARLAASSYIKGYLCGAAVSILIVSRLGWRALGPETPVVGVVMNCCFVGVLMADCVLLVVVLFRWRKA